MDVQALRRIVEGMMSSLSVPTLRWATVTQVSPLRIQYIGEDPLPFTPTFLGPTPILGANVLTVQWGTRITILGAQGPEPAPVVPVMPRFRATISASKSMASGTTDLSGWDTPQYNVGSGFVASTGVFTAPSDGLYTFGLSVLTSTSSVRRFCQLADGSGNPLVRSEGPATGYSGMSLTTEMALLSGQSVKPQFYCSGATSIRGDFVPASYYGRRIL